MAEKKKELGAFTMETKENLEAMALLLEEEDISPRKL